MALASSRLRPTAAQAAARRAASRRQRQPDARQPERERERAGVHDRPPLRHPAGEDPLESDVGQAYAPRFSTTDANGDYHFAENITHGGTYHFQAYPASEADAPGTLLLSFSLVVGPALKVVAIQSPFNAFTGLKAPGCSVCLIRDPRDDTHGGGPDIASFSIAYKGGWVSIKLVTYDTVRAGHGEHPCINGMSLDKGSATQFGLGCFEGPHVGKIFGNGECVHPDGEGDCGSAHMLLSGHTTSYRFPVAALKHSRQLALQAWVLASGDRLEDTVPNVVRLGNLNKPNCYVIVQIKSGSSGDYQSGKSLCSQAGVVTARP